MAETSTDVKGHLALNFGKRLAHTDKIVRDRGFKLLKKWLQGNTKLSRLDYMKLWKGLYFGMWMSDKRPVQQELCVNIGLLLNDVPSERRDVWLDAFWETMQTGWEKLDKHRMSKYMLFTRIVVAEAFKALRVSGWPPERARALGNIFTAANTSKRKSSTKRESFAKCSSVQSVGFMLQFLRIFWEELTPQLEQTDEMPSAALLQLLEPFCTLAEESPLRNLVNHLHENVLRKAPQAITKALSERLLAGAARAETFPSNRNALYETAEALERELRRHSTGKSANLFGQADGVVRAGDVLPESASASQAAGQPDGVARGKKRKHKAARVSQEAVQPDGAAGGKKLKRRAPTPGKDEANQQSSAAPKGKLRKKKRTQPS